MWQAPANLTEDESLHNRTFVFRNREDAGRSLAKLLSEFRGSDALVLAVPAGGVPVAIVVADILGLTLQTMVVSKLTLPWNTEAGFGAIAADGTCKINEALVKQVGLSKNSIDAGIEKTTEKVERRDSRFGEIVGRRPLAGKMVIIVDDGLASGFTMKVAIAAARNQRAARILVAVPTGHSTSVTEIARECDHLYCANVRAGMRYAVAEAYEQWSDVSEEEVIKELTSFRQKGNQS